MNEAAVAPGPPERLHPVSILSSLGASIRGMWGLFAAGGYFAIKGNWGLAGTAVAIWLAISVGAAIVRWRTFEFRVGEREIQIDSGLLNRRHRSIPFDRIQDVTIEQSPLARALGLARVRFETGGGSSPIEGSDEGSLAAVALARAESIRDLVRARRGLATAPMSESEEQDCANTVFAMDLRRVLLAGVFNFSLAIVGAIIGASQTFGDAIGFDPFSRGFWNSLLAASAPLQSFVLAHQLIVAIAGSVLLVLIGLGTGIFRTLLMDFGFRLDRTEIGLRRRRGLLTVTDVVLPAKRTQAAIIASGPVRERFGWYELKLQSLAKELGGKDDHVVAPLAGSEEVGAVLESIDWPAPGRPDWKRVSTAYVWTLAIGLLPILLLAAAQIVLLFLVFRAMADSFSAQLLGNALTGTVISLLVVLLPSLAILMRWLAWRRYGYALDGGRLLVQSGWWRRRTRILPIKNIQSVDYRQSLLGRWFGIADLVIGVAGGGLSGHRIRALPSETARELRDQLLSGFR